jgi:flavin-dependent dehydrogenase
MNALEAAGIAVKTIVTALEQGDPRRLGEYSRRMRRKPRREQLFYGMLKQLIIGFTDQELCRALKTAGEAFDEPVRRDRPFAPPILKLAPLLGRHIPQIAANAGIMLK